MSETISLVNNSITEICQIIDYEETKTIMLMGLRECESATKQLEEFMTYKGEYFKEGFQRARKRFNEIITGSLLFWPKYKGSIDLAKKMNDKDFMDKVVNSINIIYPFFDKHGDELIKYINYYHPAGSDMTLTCIGHINNIKLFCKN